MTTTVCVLGCETNKKYVPKILFHVIFSYIIQNRILLADNKDITIELIIEGTRHPWDHKMK